MDPQSRKRKVIFPVCSGLRYQASRRFVINGNDRQNFNESYKWTLKQSRERKRRREREAVVICCPDVVPGTGAALILATELLTSRGSAIEPARDLFRWLAKED